MKKTVANAKLRGPSKFLRLVLSKKSSTSNSSSKSAEADKEVLSMQINFEAEINSLKQQIGKLQLVVNGMQNDTEKKEEAIANLAREKEKLSCDLNKERRETKKLKQQLDDERDFYYREKESYCREMNECKKLKKKLSKSKREAELEQELANFKVETEKIKETLTKTLEANYNLCIKFLRMKNTKHCLRSRLKKTQTSFDKLKVECETRISVLRNELSEVVSNQLQHSIHPSNKRYLQVVKQNANLMHENMCLQVEIDRISLELERLKMMEIKKDTDSKLKYINSKTKSEICSQKVETPVTTDSTPSTKRKEKTIENFNQHSIDNKIVKPPTNTVHFSEASSTEVHKLFERNETSGIPTIAVLNYDSSSHMYSNKNDLNTPPQKDSNHQITANPSNASTSRILRKEASTSMASTNCPSSMACLQVSEVSVETFESTRQERFPVSGASPKSNISECSYYPASEATRTQSAPEIVQSSCFVNQT